jgi:hypothetical protein
LRAGEQRLDGPALRIGLDDGHGRHGGVGGQQAGAASPSRRRASPTRTRRPCTTTPRRERGRQRTWRGGPPAAVAGRCGGTRPAAAPPPRRRSGAIQPRAPALPGARGGGNSNRAVSRLTWPTTAWPRCIAARITEPRMYQASSSRTQGTEAVADRPQQRLGQGDLPGMTDAAAQAGHDRNRARPVAAGHDRAERDEGLAQQESRAVGLPRLVEPHGSAGRLGRATRRQRVVDHGESVVARGSRAGRCRTTRRPGRAGGSGPAPASSG